MTEVNGMLTAPSLCLMPRVELTPKQRLAIAALVAGSTVEDAARTAGCARSTLHVWLDLPGFKGAIRDAQSAVFEESCASLQRATSKATSTLTALLESNDRTIRLRAACAIVDLAFKSRTLLDTESRLAQLEATVQEYAK